MVTAGQCLDAGRSCVVTATVQVVNGDEPISFVGSVSICLKNECVFVSFSGVSA